MNRIPHSYDPALGDRTRRLTILTAEGEPAYELHESSFIRSDAQMVLTTQNIPALSTWWPQRGFGFVPPGLYLVSVGMRWTFDQAGNQPTWTGLAVRVDGAFVAQDERRGSHGVAGDVFHHLTTTVRLLFEGDIDAMVSAVTPTGVLPRGAADPACRLIVQRIGG